MYPLLLGLGPSELLIILAIVLLLFGGQRLAGLGKSTGRAIREFKEETKDLRGEPKAVEHPEQKPAADEVHDVHDAQEIHEAEIVDPENKKDH